MYHDDAAGPTYGGNAGHLGVLLLLMLKNTAIYIFSTCLKKERYIFEEDRFSRAWLTYKDQINNEHFERFSIVSDANCVETTSSSESLQINDGAIEPLKLVATAPIWQTLG